MNEDKQNLKGSRSRDTFKQKHKQMNSPFYASDIDLALVCKDPAGVVAYVDFKLPEDYVTFSEALVYNELSQTTPVYIVESADPEQGPFYFYKYCGGDWRPEPPAVTLHLMRICQDWSQFEDFEASLRRDYCERKRTGALP